MSKNGDLFNFFNAMNKGDFNFVNKMDDDEVKTLSPFVLLMWVNGATQNQPIHIIATEALCASTVFSLAAHPRLLLKLFIAANCDVGNTRYKFKKSVMKKQSKNIELVARHYECGYTEATQYLKLLSPDDIKELQEMYEDVD